MNKKRLCAFLAFTLMVLYFAGFTQAQQSPVYNFRWLGDTGLALSGQPENSDQWETVKSLGINATVNLRSEAQDNETYLNSIGIEYYYLPITSNGVAGSWNLTEQQTEAPINWINSKLAEGKKVLIHCQVGQNRAPTMAMMWYIHEGHTADEAYNWVLQYPVSAPYDSQKQCAIDYYNWLLQQLAPTLTPSPSSTSTATPTSIPDAGFPINFVYVIIGALVAVIASLLFLLIRKQKKPQKLAAAQSNLKSRVIPILWVLAAYELHRKTRAFLRCTAVFVSVYFPYYFCQQFWLNPEPLLHQR